MQFDIDITSEHKTLFLEARSILTSFSGIIETKKTRITTYSNKNGGICHMRTMPYGIDFGFLKGSRFFDKYGLLTGNGKLIRVLSFKGELDLEIIKYYIGEAILVNSK